MQSRTEARTHKCTHFDANAFFFCPSPSSSLHSQVRMRLCLAACAGSICIRRLLFILCWLSQTSLPPLRMRRTEVFHEKVNNNNARAMNEYAQHLCNGRTGARALRTFRNWWWKVTRSTFLRSQRYKLIQIKKIIKRIKPEINISTFFFSSFHFKWNKRKRRRPAQAGSRRTTSARTQTAQRIFIRVP